MFAFELFLKFQIFFRILGKNQNCYFFWNFEIIYVFKKYLAFQNCSQFSRNSFENFQNWFKSWRRSVFLNTSRFHQSRVLINHQQPAVSVATSTHSGVGCSEFDSSQMRQFLGDFFFRQWGIFMLRATKHNPLGPSVSAQSRGLWTSHDFFSL